MSKVALRLFSVGMQSVSLIAAILISLFTSQPAHAVIEEGLSIGIRDFAVLPDSAAGNSAPARANVMTADPLGRLFVNDQRGPLYTVSVDGATVTNYLDLSTYADINLVSGFEQGFSSFAFHPDFATPATSGFGKFYTIHSSSDKTPAPTYPFVSNTGTGSSNTHDTVLLEWSVTNPSAATYAAGGGDAPREVLRLEQPESNHNSGLVAFNTSIGSGHADYGNLYVAIGDGGDANDPWNIAADPNKPYGKILRIDPIDPNGAANYGIVADNVFAADADPSTLAEVYAYGLRNPQRFGWDDNTGDLYAADIGQDEFEEINLIANGGNYGWDNVEGNSNPINPALEDPIANYRHTGDLPLPQAVTGGRAITMGEVVRATGIPGLDGLLLSGDFPAGVPLHIDVSGGPPAERSGVDPFAELILVDVDGSGLPVELLQLINDTRDANGINDSSRADLRWSLGIDGRVFLTNKKDGVIRELVHLLLGDFDYDNDVDGLDFLKWQRGETTMPLSALHLADWENNYGNVLPIAAAATTVPEPTSVLLAALAFLVSCTRGRRN
jgi:hypothetical protein